MHGVMSAREKKESSLVFQLVNNAPFFYSLFAKNVRHVRD